MSLQVFDGRVTLALTKHFLAADTTAWIDMGYSPAQAELVTTILLTNEDTIDHVVRFAYKVGASYFVLGSINVPAGAGLAGAAPVDLMSILPLGALPGFIPSYNNQLALSLEATMVGTHWLDALILGVVF